MPYDAHVPIAQPYRVYVPVPEQSQAGRAQVPIPEQNQIDDESRRPADKVGWRTALLLMFVCFALVWTGIGLLIAN
jgi:hypothetical protein